MRRRSRHDAGTPGPRRSGRRSVVSRSERVCGTGCRGPGTGSDRRRSVPVPLPGPPPPRGTGTDRGRSEPVPGASHTRSEPASRGSRPPGDRAPARSRTRAEGPPRGDQMDQPLDQRRRSRGWANSGGRPGSRSPSTGMSEAASRSIADAGRSPVSRGRPARDAGGRWWCFVQLHFRVPPGGLGGELGGGLLQMFGCVSLAGRRTSGEDWMSPFAPHPRPPDRPGRGAAGVVARAPPRLQPAQDDRRLGSDRRLPESE